MKLPTKLGTPCREWQGRRAPFGYGTLSRERRVWQVHRWVWTLANGPIPPGMIVMHRCDNPPCFRLDHLKLGTLAENSADAASKGRLVAGERHAWTKLTQAQVDEIRDPRNAHVRPVDFGARFGVTPANIGHIRKRRSWRNS